MHRHRLDGSVRIAGTSYSKEGGYRAGRELLDRPDRPTAIFAGADIAAVGVLRAAYEIGLRIPGDLSLVGYDNTTIAFIAPINLTSVDQAGHDRGRRPPGSCASAWTAAAAPFSPPRRPG
jgi:LacI family transcriptional regulator